MTTAQSRNIPPNPVKRIGLIGGGQLAWMMAPAAQKLQLDLIVQTPAATDPAAAIATQTILAPIHDATATAQLARQCDVITFENEFVDLDALAVLVMQGVIFRPGLTVLRSLLDKFDQRQFFQQHGLPTPLFQSPAPAVPPSFPAVLKTRRMGYDGQGTFIPQTLAAYQAIVERIGAENLLWEEFVPFDRELAVVAARDSRGHVVIYPIVETQQVNQVCHWVLAPAAIPDTVAQAIQTIAQTIMAQLDVVGVLGIELFITADDGQSPTGGHRILVNEIAPRTHNSGHYSLDACITSQFEQQLRAVADLPLGDPSLNCPGAIMVNLLGFEAATTDYAAHRAQLAAIPHAQVHWYGKAESRPGRKLGHVTVRLWGDDWRSQAQGAIALVESIWYPSPDRPGEISVEIPSTHKPEVSLQ
jgi:5-(carboxyamino)imidazole ribonucleotide synthase